MWSTPSHPAAETWAAGIYLLLPESCRYSMYLSLLVVSLTFRTCMKDVMKLLVLCYVLPAPPHNEAPACEASIDIAAIKDSSQPSDAVEAEGGNTGEDLLSYTNLFSPINKNHWSCAITISTTVAEHKLDLPQQPCNFWVLCVTTLLLISVFLGSREDYLRDLFPDSFADSVEDRISSSSSGGGSSSSSSSSSSSGIGTDGVDCSTYKCLDRLIVHPVTVLGKLASSLAYILWT